MNRPTNESAPRNGARGRITSPRIVSRIAGDALDVRIDFAPVVEAQADFALGILAWTCGHCPSAKVASIDIDFKLDEIADFDDATAVVETALESWSKPPAEIADACRLKLMRTHCWYGSDINIDCLALRQWSEPKLARLFDHKATRITEIRPWPVDVFYHVVGKGFTRNVTLLRELADDARKIRDAVAFIRATAETERTVSP